MRILLACTVCSLGMFLFSCSTTRSLGEDEYLYKKTIIKSPEGEEKLPGNLEKDLENSVVHQTNRKILGVLPIRLWLYHLPGDTTGQKGLGRWIRTKLGEPPETFQSYEVEATVDEMGKVLRNNGYFDYTIRPEQVTDDKKLSMLYQVRLEEPYRVSGVIWPRETDSLTSHLQELAAGSLLVPGEQFSLDKLQEERARLMGRLKSTGFFFLMEDHIYFSLDTALQDQQVEVTVRLREDMDPAARKVQYIQAISVHHLARETEGKSLNDTLVVDSIRHIYRDEPIMDPEMLNNALVFTPGERYREGNYRNTLRRLNGLGIFQFISINFIEQEEPDQLEAVIRLTPALPQSFRAEIQAVTRSNDYTGPVLQISYHNQNFNDRAATFRTHLNTGYAVQIGSDRRGYHSVDAGLQFELDVPRLLVPGFGYSWFRKKGTTPLTVMRAGYTYFLRSNLFTAHSFDGSFGYRWDPSATLSHELSVISLDYTRLNFVEAELVENDTNRLRLRDELISLLRYEFTLNNLARKRTTNVYNQFSIETAGNLPGLATALGAGQSETGEPATIAGVPYSTYGRISEDFRFYYHPAEDNSLVTRLFAGLGIPYGNSDQLPYKRQFFVGGVSSLRSFPVRELGPGSYEPPDTLSGLSYLYQVGDIKLEANIEYRFPIVSVVNGAVFADAGNVWLYNRDPLLPGGLFTFQDFIRQVGVGTGLGIRLDLTILVLRLDVAFPLRKPYRPEGDRWIFDQIDFTEPQWRKDNLVFNLAIGYPF
jgi:outer membrane protein insertion porin family